MKNPFFLSLLLFFLISSKIYADNICSSTSSTADNGSLYDSGGSSSYYSNYENCGFLIQPASSPTNITLSFSQFSVENGWDYLYVYDGTNSSGSLLGTFTGYSLPTDVTATSGSMYLRFVSDNIYRYQGFSASWTSSTVQAELKASYNFDDDWDTNNTLTDQTGAYSGTPSGSISRVSAGASGSKGDTCYAASFSGGEIDITNLPVSTSTGAKTSISFWMYWDGTKNVMPMGWYQHDLFFGANNSGAGSTIYFGFNTWGWDVTGIAASGLDNGWHHVAAVFTNGSVANNKLYIDGVLQSIAYRTGAVTTGNAYVQSTLVLGASSASSSWAFSGEIDNLKVYTGAITQSQVAADMNESNACPGPATPILEYKFDACSLASTVEDSQGNYDGVATGTDSTGSTSILGGRSLDLSSTDTSDWVTVPGSVITGLTDFSFSVWIKTDTSSLQQEIFQALGSSIYDDELEIYLKYSNTIKLRLKDKEETLSTITTLTDNTWHHLVLTRKNDNICLYVDGSQTDCDSGASTGTLSVPYSNSVVIGQEQDSTRSSPSLNSGFNSAQSFKGYIDELKIYDSVLSSTQIQTLYNNESSGDNTLTCSGGGGDTPATNFNCVENDANGISGNLYTKTTAQSFSFDVIALQDVSNIETSFASGANHTVTVELVDASSGTCLSYSALSPSVSQNLLFTASDSGTKASAVMSSSTAYKNVKCRVTDNTDSPVVVGCSTDSFAIRPINFSITSNLTNSGFSSTPKVKTGENFTLTATATSGYNSIPEINNGKLEAHSGAILMGNISGSFGSADSITGTATGTAFTYNEVGSLRFKEQGIYDDTFTAVDQGSDCTNDFSNTLVGDKVGCKFGNTSDSNFFGRFTPDHFDVTLNTPIFSTSCGSFTYIGQPVKYTTQPVASIAAKNSSDTTTQNYTGDFWKIDPTDNTYTPTYTEASHTLFFINDNPSVTDNGDGTGILSFADTTSNILSINRNTPETEFDAEIAMNFNLSDTDGIAVANVNGTPQSNPISFGTTSPGNGINFSSNKTQRWGRIVLNNAHGSELSVLAVPLQTEYFNGSDFILNTNDNCTSITLNSQILLSNPNTSSGTSQPGNTAMTIGSGTSSATLLNIPLSAGSANLNFSAPGAGNTGYIDINSDFSIFPWLLFDWDNNSSHDNSPSGKATFGIFKGNSNQIYFREVY